MEKLRREKTELQPVKRKENITQTRHIKTSI